MLANTCPRRKYQVKVLSCTHIDNVFLFFYAQPVKNWLGLPGPWSVYIKHRCIACTMSAPEEKEGAADLQLSFVFGNSVVKPQTPHFLPEEAGPQELVHYSSAETLCLSRTKLKYVAECILRNSTLKVSLDLTVCLFISTCPAAYCLLQCFQAKISAVHPQQKTVITYFSDLCLSFNYSFCHLQHLYLEGNQISSIPHSLFISLPNLQWLDLRNNQIVSLPAEIGMHR